MNRGRWENIIFNKTGNLLTTVSNITKFKDICNDIVCETTNFTKELYDKNTTLLLNYFKSINADIDYLDDLVYNEKLNNQILELQIPELRDEIKLKQILAYIILEKTTEINDDIDISNIELPENINDVYDAFYNILNDKEIFLSNVANFIITYFSDIADKFNYMDIYNILNNNNVEIINNLSDEQINDILDALNKRISIDGKHSLLLTNIIDIILNWQKTDKLPEFDNIQKELISNLKQTNMLYNDFKYKDGLSSKDLLIAIINTINTLNTKLNIIFEKDEDLKNDIILKIYNFFSSSNDKLKVYFLFVSRYITDFINLN